MKLSKSLIAKTEKRPKQRIKEEFDLLAKQLNQITNEFDVDQYDDVYGIKLRELEAEVLELLEKGSFSNEKIAKIIAFALIKYEKNAFNRARIQTGAFKATDKLKVIEVIESSIPKGGKPTNEEIFKLSRESFEEYKKTHNGNEPSAPSLSNLVSQKLEDELHLLKDKEAKVGKQNLTLSENKFLSMLKQKELSAESGHKFYSERTASSHIKKIKALGEVHRKPQDE